MMNFFCGGCGQFHYEDQRVSRKGKPDRCKVCIKKIMAAPATEARRRKSARANAKRYLSGRAVFPE